MLSITLLAPLISIISKISLDWTFKIIYPILFSFVPLGLYIVFKKQTSEKIAFLSTFFFMSFYVFYTEMIGVGRQEIAEVFLVLIILVMITKKISNITRSFLLIIFGISLIVSHYGLAYIYMFSLLIVYFLILLNDHYNLPNKLNYILRNNKTVAIQNKYSKNRILSFTFILFFIVFTFSWYMYTSSGISFIVFLKLGSTIANTISSQFLNPTSVQNLAIIQSSSNTLHNLFRYGNYIIEVLIITGVFSILLRDRMKFRKEYLGFIITTVLIQIGAVTVPYFSSALNSERLYQITLIFLAPACIIGGLTLFDILYRILNIFKIQIKNFNSIKFTLLSLYFVIFLLFSSGFVFYITNENSNSIALNSTVDTANYNIMEIQGANWLNNYGVNIVKYGTNSHSGMVVADEYRQPLIIKYGLNTTPYSYYYNSNFNVMNNQIMSYNSNKNNFYFFFGTNNILNNTFLIYTYKGVNMLNETYPSSNNFNTLNKIYSSDGSQIFYES
jgi:uncharacterized membrane protein